jgi:hypothetical protein
MANPSDPPQERLTFTPVSSAEMIRCRGDRAVLRDAWLIIGGEWTEATIVRWRQLATGGWAAHVLWRPGWAAWVHYSRETVVPRTSSRPPPWGPPTGHPDVSDRRRR